MNPLQKPNNLLKKIISQLGNNTGKQRIDAVLISASVRKLNQLMFFIMNVIPHVEVSKNNVDDSKLLAESISELRVRIILLQVQQLLKKQIKKIS